jgi:hypothetical protein
MARERDEDDAHDEAARIAEEHLAVRLNDMDLQRAVEQVAILMAIFADVQPNNVKVGTQAKHALAFMLGYLSHAWCRGRVLHKDYHHSQSQDARDVWQSLQDAEHQDGTFGIAPAKPEWELDFVISPLDGVRAFIDGLDGGSIAVIGGGPPGTFLADASPLLADDYLVVTAHASALRKGGLIQRVRDADLLQPSSREAQGKEWFEVDVLRAADVADRDYAARLAQWQSDLNKPTPHQVRKPERYSDLWGFLQGLAGVLGQFPSNHLVRSWATSTGKSRDFAFKEIRPTLRTLFKVRTLSGSSVAAGMTPFFPHLTIDGFVGITRRTHAILLAIAAQATGGHMLAVPVVRKKDEDYDLLPGKPLLDKDDLIRRDRDAFLVATGVSENLLVEGVRFKPNNQVSTHTLCLRSGTRSTRFVTHHHDLRRKQIRLLPREVAFLDAFFELVNKNKGLDLRRHYLPPPLQ